MCGIAGFMTLASTINPKVLSFFQEKLTHRGPDDEGHFQSLSSQPKESPSILMFHRRLSIVDLSEGHQPFVHHFPDGHYLVLIVNGEIYNSETLRQTYSTFPFKTHSDCESILPVYLAYGPREFSSHLQGMFALGLYDSRTNSLVLSRDGFGIKPLYIRLDKNTFAFASEIPALTFPCMENPLSPEGPSEALHRQYTSGSLTLFQDISRVLPGQTLLINKNLQIETFHLPPIPLPKERSSLSKKQGSCLSKTLTHFETLLLETVNTHLLSDVPVGLFYSGGVDSSVLLKALLLLGHSQVPAFHIRFEGENDSLPSKNPLSCQLTEVSFSEADFWELLPLAAFVMDDFAADYAVLPTLKLAQAVHKEKIPVILSGEGGDEIFAGYGRYRRHNRFWPWRTPLFRHKSLLYNLPIADRFSWYQDLSATERLIQKSSLSSLQKAQYMDLITWLPDDLMIKLDRPLMYYGIEGRPPFLDKAMANFGFDLPETYKVRKKDGKWLLKYWLSRVEPSLNFFVKKKGFSPPVHLWLFAKLAFLKATLLSQHALTPWIPAHHIHHLLDRLEKNPQDPKTGLAIWILLFYTLWYKIHVQGYSHEMSVFDLLEKP